MCQHFTSRRRKTLALWCAIACTLAIAVPVRGAHAADAAPDKPVAVLCLGQGSDRQASIATWALPRKLAAEHNVQVSGCGFEELTWDVLRQFNVVVVFDMSRLDPETKRVDPIDISPEGLRRVADLLIAATTRAA